MTEQEWLAATEPMPMLEFVRGIASDRKLRLFACACCRRFFCDPHGGDIPSEEAILEPMEWFADGLFGEDDRQRAEEEALNLDDYTFYALHKREALIAVTASSFTLEEIWSAIERFTQSQGCYGNELKEFGGRFLHDVIGNPFRPVTIDPEWLTPNIIDLARSIYDERCFDGLPILADDLEKAGCTSANILSHCRSEGPHVRGCWVVDLILGKQ